MRRLLKISLITLWAAAACFVFGVDSLSAQEEYIAVTSPNGGEVWQVGDTHAITWDSLGILGDVKIEYTIDNGISWILLSESTENDGEYSWVIPDSVSSECRVRISSSQSAACETRGTWVQASTINSLEKQAALFNSLEAANLNTVLVSVPRINGNWGYGDHELFLAFIQGAKNRGFSVHAWIACSRRLWGEGITYIEYRDPAEQAAQSHWVQYIMAIYGNYLDGVHLDYIRYMDFDIVNADGKMDGIRDTVRRIHDDLNAIYPDKMLSAAVFTLNPNRFDRKDDGSIWFNQVPAWFVNWCNDHPDSLYNSSNYYYLGPHHMQVQQDPVGWLQEGIIDAVMPMQYTLDDGIWQRDTNHWKSFNLYVGNDFTRVFTGMAWKTGKYDPAASVRQIKYDRSVGMKGNVIFRFGHTDMSDTPLIEALTIDSEINDFQAPYKSWVSSCLNPSGFGYIWDSSDEFFSIGSPPPPTGNKDIGSFAVFATNSLYMRTGSKVSSGNIGVENNSGGPKLGDNYEVGLSENVSMASGVSVYGNRVLIKRRSTVYDVYYNTIKNYGTVKGNLYKPLSVPMNVGLPPFPTPAPGTQTVTVAEADTVTLTPGAYGKIILKYRATLILNAGTYHFDNLQMGDKCKLLFKGPSKVIIKNRFESGANPVIGPQTSSVKAKDLVIYVKGKNGTGGSLNAEPKAATIGIRHKLGANIYAPNGTIWLKARGTAKGAFIGKDVMVEFYVQIAHSSAF